MKGSYFEQYYHPVCSHRCGERLKLMLDLPRIYSGICKLLSEPNSLYRKLNGISTADCLNKAKTIFEEMDLQWGLEQLEHVASGHH